MNIFRFGPILIGIGFREFKILGNVGSQSQELIIWPPASLSLSLSLLPSYLSLCIYLPISINCSFLLFFITLACFESYFLLNRCFLFISLLFPVKYFFKRYFSIEKLTLNKFLLTFVAKTLEPYPSQLPPNSFATHSHHHTAHHPITHKFCFLILKEV